MSISLLQTYVRTAVPLVYDESLSYLEFVAAVTAKVNEMIRELNTYLETDIQSIVSDILSGWVADGTLTGIVNTILVGQGTRTYTEQNYVTDNETLTESIDALDMSLKDDNNSIQTIDPKEYGIIGDGTDQTSKIILMMAAIPPDGANIIFDKSQEIVINGTNQIYISGKKNVVIQGLNAKGSSNAVFTIDTASHDITFRDCIFQDLNQIIYLWDCENITVDNCLFDGCGYGVIQYGGKVSNNVKVINCTAQDMYRDFVEANCMAAARSKNWIIANNIYKGSSDYELAKAAEALSDYTTYRERRFVGITALDHVVISGNIVEKSAGDAAIHLEDIGSDYVISDNIFDNILGYGYITIAATGPTQIDSECIIANNTFKRTDILAQECAVLYVSAARFINEILFTGNRIIGHTGKNLFISASSQTNLIITNNTFRNMSSGIRAVALLNSVISNNLFRDCQTCISAPTAKFCKFNHNSFYNCSVGIDLGNGTETFGAGENCEIIGNVFNGMTSYNLIARRASSGLLPPKHLFVSNNVFDINTTGHSVRIGGNTPTGSTAAQNIIFINNFMKAGATTEIINGEYKIIKDNILQNSGIIYTNSVSTVPTYIGEVALVAGVFYIATGLSSAADWKQMT